MFNRYGHTVRILIYAFQCFFAWKTNIDGLVHKGTCVVFKSMVEIGFLDMLRGSAALTQMLSSSAWHMENEAGEIGSAKGNTDYATFSVMATASLRRMLQQPSQRTSVETIIAILTFAAYAVSGNDIG